MVCAVGVDGMSGGETDCEELDGPKFVARRALDYRAKGVTESLHNIETYPDDQMPTRRDKRGNRPLPYSRSVVNVTTTPMTAPLRWPVNYYCPTWLASFEGNVAESILLARPDQEIPVIVSIHNSFVVKILTSYSLDTAIIFKVHKLC
jgi:hypothetical protein